MALKLFSVKIAQLTHRVCVCVCVTVWIYIIIHVIYYYISIYTNIYFMHAFIDKVA